MKVTESHRKLANEISKMFTFQSGIHEPSGIYYEGYTLDKEAVAQLLADQQAPAGEERVKMNSNRELYSKLAEDSWTRAGYAFIAIATRINSLG